MGPFNTLSDAVSSIAEWITDSEFQDDFRILAKLNDSSPDDEEISSPCKSDSFSFTSGLIGHNFSVVFL